MGLNISGYTLFCGNGIDSPRVYICARNMDIWMLPGFSSRDLVTVLRNYNESEAERRLVVCSAYMSYDSEDPPPTKVLGELVSYCEEKNFYLITGRDSTPQGLR